MMVKATHMMETSPRNIMARNQLWLLDKRFLQGDHHMEVNLEEDIKFEIHQSERNGFVSLDKPPLNCDSIQLNFIKISLITNLSDIFFI